MEASDTVKDIQAERPIVHRLEMTRVPLKCRRVVVNGAREIRKLALAKASVVVEVGHGVVLARLGPLYGLREVVEGRRGVAEPLAADTPVVPGQRMRRQHADRRGIFRDRIRQVV